MSDEPKHNPFDDLKDHLNFCLGIAPGKVIETFANVCEANGIRVVLAAVHDDWPHPQVQLTATMDDISAKVVAQVVDPVLHKVGLPEKSILVLSVAAGEAAVRALHKLTGQSTGNANIGGSKKWKPAWDPSKNRKA
jgi:hypothetical protein